MPAARPRLNLLTILGVLVLVGSVAALIASRGESEPEPGASPLHRDMTAWAEAYREHFSPLLPHVDAIDRNRSTRETCNALLVAIMNAQRSLPAAPDADVQGFAVDALDGFTASARGCIRGDSDSTFERDAYLVLGRSAVRGVNGLLSDRYQLSGLDELAEPIAGSEASMRMSQRLPK